MTALNLINQLLNFMAPAAFVAGAMLVLSRLFAGIFKTKRQFALSPFKQFAIVFIVSVLVLLAGLVVFGRDGKMASYALLELAAATCQWALLRGWRA